MGDYAVVAEAETVALVPERLLFAHEVLAYGTFEEIEAAILILLGSLWASDADASRARGYLSCRDERAGVVSVSCFNMGRCYTQVGPARAEMILRGRLDCR